MSTTTMAKSETGGTITRDQFMAATKRRFDFVDIVGLGVVRIRSLSEGERSRIESATVNDNKNKAGSGVAKWKARFIAAAVVDDAGACLFSDKELDTIQSFDSMVTGPLYDAIARHCGLECSTEELEKN